MHPLRVTGASGLAAGLGRAEIDEMAITDLRLREIVAQLVLENPLLRERATARTSATAATPASFRVVRKRSTSAPS
jgi:hypothetical protein